MTGFDLYPAIDLRGGRCVRLHQGDYRRETVYEDDPPAQARRFVEAGARWLHVVDLDAARTGEAANRAAVSAIAGVARDAGVPVQVGGGVRSVAAAEALFATGVARVVVGTAALEEPALVAELAPRRPVALGLDVRGRRVAVRGWAKDAGVDLLDVVDRFVDVPLAALIVTQIAVDGTQAGPDLDLYSTLMAHTDLPILASGGVGQLRDLVALRELAVGGRHLAGVIVGRALYEGSFGLAEALAMVGGWPSPAGNGDAPGGDGDGPGPPD